VVNGGCCSWGDINWVHYLHSAWCWTGRLPWKARVKEAVAGYLFRGQERKALRAARLVIANSNSTRLALVNGLKLDPARVHTVYLGCEPSWHPPEASERSAGRKWLDQPEGRPLILFVGGLGHDGRKGFDVLWTAWRSLCSDPNWDADLVVAGGGAASASWEARVGREGLTGRVRLIGFTDRVFDLLAAADLLVSPARYEPYGLNVQEAVCRGVPALTSARAGVVEHYPPELGDLILPDPEDWQDLARRLRLWRADVAGWRERFRPLSGVLRDHTWDATAAHIVRLAEEGLTQSQCSPARAQDECQSLVVRHD
jgi:glycosyltransferase involved in cell wall biosynthesis